MTETSHATKDATAGVVAAEATIPDRRPSQAHRFRNRFLRHRLGMFGLSVLAVLVLVAILAPWVAGYSPTDVDFSLKDAPPSREHIFGTDRIGRDVWARVVFGTRVSLSVGAVAVGIYTTIALILGSLAGYLGGRVESVIMRLTDVMMCFPTFLLIIAATAILPPNILNIMLIIGIFGWPGMCRLVRGQFLTLRSRDFVVAAVSVGVPRFRIIFRHMLPNAVGPVLVAATLGLGGAILTEAGLSFLGLGVQEPTPSWGSMLLISMQLPILEGMPWRWIPPAVAISLTVLSFNFAGDALRDALDPRATVD
jgi:peptide/nickel transport system permease protein